MSIKVISSLSEVRSEDWNRLSDGDNPFVRYEFLKALEQNHCLEEYGWYPQHVVLYENNTLVAAMPMYIKDNSYGELVFDWSWADAYHRHGVPYYPKLVTAIPYTPATGPRLLVSDGYDHTRYASRLIEHAISLANSNRMSSIHWLFTNDRDTSLLKQQGMSMRLGCQFHWTNQDYDSFDTYLENFSSQKRKKIRRERKRVREEGVTLEVLHGNEMDDRMWTIFHDFYTSTFDRKSGMATLSLDFFRELGEKMPESVVIIFALHDERHVASAFNVRGKTTLYGRHWGCNDYYHSLHFETCYYQGLDYCIKNRLKHFEPGAQGEHKISRGFLPTPTWSGHWIANQEFSAAIDQFSKQEQRGMEHYISSLQVHSPFKHLTDTK